MQAEALAKRAEARKVSQEYARRQREAGLAQLEASLPKRPSNPYFLFSAEVKLSGEALMSGSARQADQNKKIAAMWAALSAEEKQKYKDRYDAENKKYHEWAHTEEGQRIISERNEVLRQCRAAQGELAEAVAASEPGQQGDCVMPPRGVSTFETPVKRHRVAFAKTPPVTEVTLEEEVLEEADRANLLASLRNLAGRPDVLALKKSSQELLQALKANDGMVNAAKRSLLSA